MEYVQFGRTGLRVSRLCLGSDSFGHPHGCDEKEARRIIARAYESGIFFLDTAQAYADGRSEEIIGRYLRDSGVRDQIVIGTKFRSRMGSGPNDATGSRQHIMRAVEGSLRRLQTDRIDVYYMHHFDPTTPLEETLRALDDLVKQGKILYAGCSNFAAWAVVKSLWISDVRNLVRFDCAQSIYNIVQPWLKVDLLPVALDEGMAVVTYSPLGAGLLTGKHPRSAPLGEGMFGARDQERGGPLAKLYLDDHRCDTVDRLSTVADKHGVPAMHLALRWVAETPGITSVIFGARTEEQLEAVLDAWSGNVSQEAIKEVIQVANEFSSTAHMSFPPPPPPSQRGRDHSQ